MNIYTFIPIIKNSLFALMAIYVIASSHWGWRGGSIYNKTESIEFKFLTVNIMLSLIIPSIVCGFLLVFYISAGLVVGKNFYFSLIYPGILLYTYHIIYTAKKQLMYSEKEINIFKHIKILYEAKVYSLMLTIIVAPLIISTILFYSLFGGDKIYSISAQCKAQNNTVFCQYNNGNYTGDIKGFLRHGKGTYQWKSGKVYKGEWKNNLMDGVGEMTENGKTVKGIWKKHQFLNE
ncbi:hypothetical protein N9S28_01370 [Candidatus Pelagibacter sp.]|nr:hypothetical protein [Candidatus Pelagibacter sp.]